MQLVDSGTWTARQLKGGGSLRDEWTEQRSRVASRGWLTAVGGSIYPLPNTHSYAA